MKHTISYDGNDRETYSLLVDGKEVAEILLGEDAARLLLKTIVDKLFEDNYFLGHESEKRPFEFSNEFAPSPYIIDIKNDDDKLGIIVDVFDEIDEENVMSYTYWFEDFIED